MRLGVVVLIAWLVATALLTLVIFKRIEQRKPGADWGGPMQLIWAALCALIVFSAVYVMLTGAANGRMLIPSKQTPSPHFDIASQPIGFWSLLAIEFLLTTVLSAVLAASTLLVLRSSRRRA